MCTPFQLPAQTDKGLGSEFGLQGSKFITLITDSHRLNGKGVPIVAQGL